MSTTQHDPITDVEANGVLSYESVRDAVQSWPLSMRAALIRDLLDTLVQQAVQPQPKKNTFSEAFGLLATDKPAPTDEEVERWLDEHRMERYG